MPKTNRYPSLSEIVTALFLSRNDSHDALTQEQRAAQNELRADMTVSLPSGVIMPFHIPEVERRDMTVTGQTSFAGDQGGATVGSEVIEVGPSLRSALVLSKLGGRIFTGLRSDVRLPGGKATLSAAWLAENAVAADDAEALRSLNLSPHRVSASLVVSTQLLTQGGALFSEWLNRELMDCLAVEIERVAIAGSGSSSEPMGIINHPDVTVLEAGANGAAPDYNHVTDLEYQLTGPNDAGRGPLGFLLSPYVRRKLRRTITVGPDGSAVGPIWLQTEAERLLGYLAGVTNAAPDTLSKGTSGPVCSALIFGNFGEHFTTLWGPGISINVVTDRDLAIAGKVKVVAGAYVDCGIRQPDAFVAYKDLLCA